MIHEVRMYYCVPGRLPALHKRFQEHTLRIWDRFGIKQVGFWTTLIGEHNQALYYMLEWESLADREAKWNAFQVDPEWMAARAESEKDGPILTRVINYILQPTPYSAMK